MKKFRISLAFLLAMILLLSACGGSDDSSEGGQSGENTKTEGEGTDNGESSEKEAVLGSVDTLKAPVILESLMYNDKGLKMTLNEITFDEAVNSFLLGVTLENSTDKKVDVSLVSSIIDGVFMDLGLSGSVMAEANSTGEGVFYIDLDYLKNAGLKGIGVIEYVVRIDNMVDDIQYSERVKLETSEAGVIPYTPNDAGVELFNKDGVRVVGQGLTKSVMGDEYKLFIENNTDTAVAIRIADGKMILNGSEVRSFFSQTVPYRSVYYTTEYLWSDEIKALSADGIESLKFAIEVEKEPYAGDIIGVGQEIEIEFNR